MKIPDVKWIVNKKIIHRRYRYEPKVMSRLKRIHGDLFVDIGANVGQYSSALRKNFREIIAFEPNVSYLPIIKRKMKGVNNIRIEQLAVTNTDGSVVLFPHDGGIRNVDTIMEEFRVNLAGSPESKKVLRGTNGVRVNSVSFDGYFGQRAIDLVKIDVEGAEFLVLEGMSKSLSNRRVQNIVIELHDLDKRDRLLALLRKYFPQIVWLGLDHCFATLTDSVGNA